MTYGFGCEYDHTAQRKDAFMLGIFIVLQLRSVIRTPFAHSATLLVDTTDLTDHHRVSNKRV